jgi:ubiquinone/menaquinone biosynthesis C-methylase UbiE
MATASTKTKHATESTQQTWDSVWQNMDKSHRKYYSRVKAQSYLQFSAMMANEYIGKAVFPDKEQLACLECGSGRADVSNYFAGRRKYKTTCLDFSSNSLRLARDNFRQEGNYASFIQGSVTSLPFADNSFDIVFCVVLLELFQDVQPAINEMVRVLKPGGVFFTAITSRKFNVQILLNSVYRLTVAPAVILRNLSKENPQNGFQKVKNMFQQDYFTNSYTLIQYQDFLRNAGLTEIKAVGFGPFPTLPYRPPWLDRIYLKIVMSLTWLRRKLKKTHPWVTSSKWGVFWYLHGKKQR